MTGGDAFQSIDRGCHEPDVFLDMTWQIMASSPGSTEISDSFPRHWAEGSDGCRGILEEAISLHHVTEALEEESPVIRGSE